MTQERVRDREVTVRKSKIRLTGIQKENSIWQR